MPVKWMEIIRLRVAVDQMNLVGPQLEILLDSLNDVPGLEQATAYLGVSSPGDMGLTLHWDTRSTPPPFGSPVAQSLVPACKKFGLVDHSVWIKADRDGKGGRSEAKSPTGPDPNPLTPTTT